jgi:hypothetical protein
MLASEEPQRAGCARLVEARDLRCSSPVVLELLLCLLPRVAPEHTGELGDLEIKLLVRQGTGVEPELRLRILGITV